MLGEPRGRGERRRTVNVNLRIVLLAGATLLLSSCTGSKPSTSPAPKPAPKVRMTKAGACGEAFFWVTNQKSDVAVTFSLEAKVPPSGAPTVVRFDLPDDRVRVEVLRGASLARNFCTDLLDLDSMPTSTAGATSARGQITIEGPTNGCGTAKGRLQVDGLVAGDGTVFEPIDVGSDQIGCYSG